MADDSEPGHVIACAAAFLALCPLLVGIRFLTRLTQVPRKLGIDDWLTIPALLMVVGCAIVLIIGVDQKAFGYPTPKEDPDNHTFRLNEQLSWSFFLMVILALGFIKLSFIFCFRRLFCIGNPKSAFSIATCIATTLVILWTAGFFFWMLFNCSTHFTSRWTSVETYHTYCRSDDDTDIGLAISDLVTDVAIYFLPVPVVLRLQMKLVRRLLVLFMFLLGSMALVASAIRLSYFVYAVQVSKGYKNDPTLDNNLLVTRGVYWSMLECGLSLTCACLPSLNGFARLPGIQSVLSSARSLFSLDSRDYRSSPQQRRSAFMRRRDELDTESQATFADAGLRPVEMVSVHSVAHTGGKSFDHGVSVDAIHVESTIEQTSSKI